MILIDHMGLVVVLDVGKAMRQIRRHHAERLKKKRKVYWGDYGPCARRQTGRMIGLKLSAPKPQSSCRCCINPRKYEGPTKPELMSELKKQEEVEDLK